MSNDISVIIPASNEETHIRSAIASVRAQEYAAEIIVVVNGSRDATADIAREMGATVIEHASALHAGGARNVGARAAHQGMLVFLDADSKMGPEVLHAIGACQRDAFGTVLGRPIEQQWRYRCFFFVKNTAHRLGLYRGALGGLFFCPAALFHRVGGYDTALKVNEIYDVIARLRGHGTYVLLTDRYAATSMRRFEKQGFLRPLLFWIWVKVRWPWQASRKRLGRAYAAAHDSLFS